MLQARQSVYVARSSTVVRPLRPSKLSSRPFRAIFGAAAGLLLLSLGCNTYNPYLGASPTVSSSINSISPSGANAAANHPDVFLTVTGSGFVANSNVTWNTSGSSSTNLVSNFVSATEMQANLPGSFLTIPGDFSIGVIAPGPASGNNAGNNISNFVLFKVFAASSSAVATTSLKTSTLSRAVSARLSAPIQTAARYQPIVADSGDAAFQTATGITAIFLRDTCLGAPAGCSPQIIPISLAWDGAEPNAASSSPSVTTNGRFVVFASEANNLVKGDSNGWSDIFRRDTCISATSACVPTTIRLSIAPDGAQANGPSFAPAISPDGRFVAFNSSATNLVRPDLNAASAGPNPPLFLRDTCFGATSGCVPATSRVVPASVLQR